MLYEITSILKGKSLLRTLMNAEAANFSLSGKVLDIGGGQGPSYLEFFKKGEYFQYESLDISHEAGHIGRRRIDIEKEKLPYGDAVADSVLMFNILEHIYNYRHVVAEARRALKADGRLFGFVPFLLNYHPDPHDYFRYTKESLERIFREAGFKNISIKLIGKGPFFVNFNNLLGIARPLRFLLALLFPLYYLADYIFLKLRPSARDRYPLGYFFVVKI